MTWDPLRREVVLHGGDKNNVTKDDTWSWDGSTWTRRLEKAPPRQMVSEQWEY